MVRVRLVEDASALKAAEPYDDTGSTMTVKGSATVFEPAPQVTSEILGRSGKLPTHHELRKDDQETEKELKQVAPAEEMMCESRNETIPTLASSEIIAARAKDNKQTNVAVGGGTHRFTLVDKDAVPLINGKKVSACK